MFFRVVQQVLAHAGTLPVVKCLQPGQAHASAVALPPAQAGDVAEQHVQLLCLVSAI